MRVMYPEYICWFKGMDVADTAPLVNNPGRGQGLGNNFIGL